MQVDDTVTEQELRRAFRDSGLWNLGYTFSQALGISMIYTSLVGRVKAVRKLAKRHQQPNLQPRLL
ncbi:hypothetical protein [Flavobacterium sp.]|jgi:hypothetical protein|uniref:hypothetical protein n=1 Tax=Flavobacterium sp. TaxID=239 RepID=UPI0037BEC94D